MRSTGILRADRRIAASTGARAPANLGGVSWALVDQSIVSAVNFVTIYIFARHMETVEFGRFVLGYTALLLLTGLQGALLTQPHNVLAAALAPEAYRRFTAALAIAQAILCAATSLLLCVAAAAVDHLYSHPAAGVLFALAAAAPPWFGQEFVRRVLYTRAASRAVALNDLLSYGLQLAGAFALVAGWTERATPVYGMLVLGVSSAAGVGVGLWQLRDHVQFRGIRWRSLSSAWCEAWAFGKWLTAQNAVSWIGSQGHVWLLGVILGPGPVGAYRAATHFAHLLNPLRQAAFSYLPSRGSLAYHNGGVSRLAGWVRRAAVALLVIVLPPCLLLIYFAGDVLRLAYGARYSGPHMALILSLASVAQCITFCKFPFDIGLLALRATKRIFYVNLVPVPMLLILGTALVYLLGTVGAPLSGLLINTALLFATWAVYRRLLGGSAGRADSAP